MVPVQKSRTENYTVQVPVTETREETYQVNTPNGVETRTRTYNVTVYNSETRSREVTYMEMAQEQRTRTVQSIEYVDSSEAAIARGYTGANGINVEILRDNLLIIVKDQLGGEPKEVDIDANFVTVETDGEDETYTVTCTIVGEKRMDVSVKVDADVSKDKLNGLAQTISSALQPQSTAFRDPNLERETEPITSIAAPRYWTHADGKRSVFASFVTSLDSEHVLLVRHRDNKRFTIPLEALSIQDVDYLNESGPQNNYAGIQSRN